MIKFKEVTESIEKNWLYYSKDSSQLTSIDLMALYSTLYYFNCLYYEKTGGEPVSFKQTNDPAFICDGNYYVPDTVFRLFINDKEYVYDRMYITTDNKLVVVVYDVGDFIAKNDTIISNAIFMDKCVQKFFILEC